MCDKVKEILLKQMELIQEESKTGEQMDRASELSELSTAMAELADVYRKL